MWARIKHILDFAFHQFGLFGTRWWHGLGTFLLIIGCVSSFFYISGEYFLPSDAFLMVSDSEWDPSEVTFICSATEYCNFHNSNRSTVIHLKPGQNLTLRANTTVWLVELLTDDAFHLRKQVLALRTQSYATAKYEIQYFPPLTQDVVSQFTIDLVKDYRQTPPLLVWSIENWNEYDEYNKCTNTSKGNQVCGAYEINFSLEMYALRFRLDTELANTAFFIAGSWLVNLSWMWALVHGLDMVVRTEKLLKEIVKEH